MCSQDVEIAHDTEPYNPNENEQNKLIFDCKLHRSDQVKADNCEQKDKHKYEGTNCFI